MILPKMLIALLLENYLLLICTSLFCVPVGDEALGAVKIKAEQQCLVFSHGFPISWYIQGKSWTSIFFITSVHRFKGGFLVPSVL